MESVKSFFSADGESPFYKTHHSHHKKTPSKQLKAYSEGILEQPESAELGAPTSPGIQKLVTDTLVERLLRMALPPSSATAAQQLESRLEAGRVRPKLSMPLMSRNFILANARFGPPFMFIDELICIFNWDNPARTLSIMFIYSLMVLKPVQFMTSLPFFYILFGVMVPNYMHIHKPDHEKLLDSNTSPAKGPPLQMPETPKPAPELSQEFVVNMTDLQNHMLLYVQAYDSIVAVLKQFAFFIDEQKSTVVFITLLVLGICNFFFIEVILPYIPYKIILLILGWVVILACHPHFRDRVLESFYSEDARLSLLSWTNRYEEFLQIHVNISDTKEHRFANIFEIQHFQPKTKTWKTIGFSSSNYSPRSNLRLQNIDIKDHCTHSLEEVDPPQDWEWMVGKNWVLDLSPQEWVSSNFITLVEVDHETKWVYDVLFGGHERGKYRRRMWVRMCTRIMDTDVKTKSGIVKDDIDEYAENDTSFGSVRGITRSSMSGNYMVLNPEDELDVEDVVEHIGELPSRKMSGASNGTSKLDTITDTESYPSDDVINSHV